MNSSSIQTIDSGDYETVMIVETYITERDMMILCDSSFAFSGNDSESPVLSTVVSRIQNTAHKSYIENGQKVYRVRCPVTDKEMDILNNVNNIINPKSAKSVLMKIQNAMKPVDKLYNIEINIPLEFKKEFEYSDKNILNKLSDNMSFNVIGINDVSPRYKINTYITHEEYNTLVELYDDDELSEYVQNFCGAIPQIIEEFNPDNERKDFINKTTQV